MRLVIAEKDALARDIARALVDAGTPADAKLPIRGGGWCVAAASGHLLSLVEPEAYDPRYARGGGWTLDDLPLFFENWRKDVRLDAEAKREGKRRPDPRAASRLSLLGKLLREADEVYHAGDPDDAGQVIVDEVLEHFGWSGPTWRVYVNDSVPANIRRAFDERVDNASPRCRGAHDAEYSREMADFAFGVNESRLIASRLRAPKLALGRVQLPTLGLVVARDAAIGAHEKRLFYEVRATVEACGETLELSFSPAEPDPEGKCFDHDLAEARARAIGQAGEIEISASTKRERRSAPLPFDITRLETEMSRTRRMSVERTLAVTQDLRTRHNAITYNRTDSGYLKTAHWEEAPRVLPRACRRIGIDWPLDFSLKSRAFDDAKAPDHHGIIPTEADFDMAALTEEERAVYEAVVRRYALQFLPQAAYDVCSVEGVVPGGVLRCRIRRVVEAGWTRYADGEARERQEDAQEGIPLPDGAHAARILSVETKEKTTSPPKRYTPGTLVADMASIAKYVADPEIRRVLKEKDADRMGDTGSIGTSATRPAAIAALKERGFIEENRGKIVSTELGRFVYGIVPDDMKGADLTARWWLVQQEVREGRRDVNDVARMVCQEFAAHKNTAYVGVDLSESLMGRTGARTVGRCPRCGKPVRETDKTLTCTSNRYAKREDGSWERTGGCGWRMSARVGAAPGKKLTPKQAERLLAGQAVAVSGIPTKKGKANARAKLPPDNGTDELQRAVLTWEGQTAKSTLRTRLGSPFRPFRM